MQPIVIIDTLLYTSFPTHASQHQPIALWWKQAVYLLIRLTILGNVDSFHKGWPGPRSTTRNQIPNKPGRLYVVFLFLSLHVKYICLRKGGDVKESQKEKKSTEFPRSPQSFKESTNRPAPKEIVGSKEAGPKPSVSPHAVRKLS